MGSKKSNAREKIKLVCTEGTGEFYTTIKNKKISNLKSKKKCTSKKRGDPQKNEVFKCEFCKKKKIILKI